MFSSTYVLIWVNVLAEAGWPTNCKTVSSDGLKPCVRMTSATYESVIVFVSATACEFANKSPIATRSAPLKDTYEFSGMTGVRSANS